jgi:hypothetical protein
VDIFCAFYGVIRVSDIRILSLSLRDRTITNELNDSMEQSPPW